MQRSSTYPVHGGQLRQISLRFNIAASRLIDFSANINPAGPPPSAIDALRSALSNPDTLTQYPDLEQTELKRAIAQHLSLTPQHVIVANGFVPLLDAVLSALSIRSCLLPTPCFAEYRQSLNRAGVDTTLHPLRPTSNFSYNAASMLSTPPEAILLANPQNPSGVLHSATFMLALIRAAAESHTYVLLDEAFVDYTPDHSLTHAIDELPNLIVFRSVTKFHAIPGLRVAYAVTNPTLASAIHLVLPPWPITNLASLAVVAALADEPYAVNSHAENVQRREELRNQLLALGLSVYPSAANFLLFQLPAAVDPDTFWQHMIEAHGVVLRSCANYEALPPGHFRAAVLAPEANARLVSAIAASLEYLL